MYLDVGLVHLDDAPRAGHCDIEAGLLGRVHEEIPIPAKVGNLFGDEVEDAAVGVHVAVAFASHMDISILCVDPLHVHHPLQRLRHLGQVHQPSAPWRTLQGTAVEAEVRAHLWVRNQVFRLDWHVREVEGKGRDYVCERRELLSCQVHVGNV